MSGLFDDPTSADKMEEEQRERSLQKMRAACDAELKQEREQQEERQPKRHKPEVDQFALAAQRMADRCKSMPAPLAQPVAQPEPIQTSAASSSSCPDGMVVIHESELAKINRIVEKKNDGTTVVHEREEKQTEKTSIRSPITFPSNKYVVAA